VVLFIGGGVSNCWPTNLLDEISVYWEPPVRDGLGGYTWNYPIEIKSRWQYSPAIAYAPNGAEVPARASVWVSTDIKVGSYLWKGIIKEVSTIFNPVPAFDNLEEFENELREIAYQVVTMNFVRSIYNKNNLLRRAYLK
jgi:hypothetical protein